MLEGKDDVFFDVLFFLAVPNFNLPLAVGRLRVE